MKTIDIVKEELRKTLDERGWSIIIYDSQPYIDESDPESDIFIGDCDEALEILAERILRSIIKRQLNGMEADSLSNLCPDNVDFNKQ